MKKGCKLKKKVRGKKKVRSKKRVGSKKKLAVVKIIGCRSKAILVENVTPRSHRTMALLQFLQFLLHTRGISL